MKLKEQFEKIKAKKRINKFMKYLKISQEEFVDILLCHHEDIKKILEGKDKEYKRYLLLKYFRELGEESENPIQERVVKKVN